MDYPYYIAQELLSGGTMVRNGRFGYRIRDSNVNPKLKVSADYGRWLIRYALKEHKGQPGIYVISLKKVRSLSGHTALKKEYKRLKKQPV